MSTTNQTVRVLALLKRFNDGEKVSIETLSNEDLWYEKSEKIIRIEDLIKIWIPFEKVIEPISLKEKIENELRDYLNL